MTPNLETHAAGGHARPRVPFWHSRTSLALCGFLVIAADVLLTGHTAHLPGALPFLLILACPLMHLFMHHGHGGHSESDNGEILHEPRFSLWPLAACHY